MDPTRTQPRTLTLPERVALARNLKRFGLGHVRLPNLTTSQRPCLGYQHGCTCGCTPKPKPVAQAPRQPWDPRPARAA